LMATREEQIKQALQEPKTVKELEQELGFQPSYYLRGLIKQGEILRSVEPVEVEEAKGRRKYKAPLYVSSEAAPEGWCHYRGQPVQFSQRFPRPKYTRAEDLLRFIEESGPITAREISQHFGVSTHVLSEHLKRLYLRGDVVRWGRGGSVTIPFKGEGFIVAAKDTPIDALRRKEEELSLRESVAGRRSLQILEVVQEASQRGKLISTSEVVNHPKFKGKLYEPRATVILQKLRERGLVAHHRPEGAWATLDYWYSPDRFAGDVEAERKRIASEVSTETAMKMIRGTAVYEGGLLIAVAELFRRPPRSSDPSLFRIEDVDVRSSLWSNQGEIDALVNVKLAPPLPGLDSLYYIFEVKGTKVTQGAVVKFVRKLLHGRIKLSDKEYLTPAMPAEVQPWKSLEPKMRGIFHALNSHLDLRVARLKPNVQGVMVGLTIDEAAFKTLRENGLCWVNFYPTLANVLSAKYGVKVTAALVEREVKQTPIGVFTEDIKEDIRTSKSRARLRINGIRWWFERILRAEIPPYIEKILAQLKRKL